MIETRGKKLDIENQTLRRLRYIVVFTASMPTTVTATIMTAATIMTVMGMAVTAHISRLVLVDTN